MSPLATSCYEPNEGDKLELVGQLSISEPQQDFQNENKIPKVHFNEQAEIRHLSEEDMTLMKIHKSEIWYMKSDLIAMRKSDRESLLVALKFLTANANQSRRAHTGEVAPPPPPPPRSPFLPIDTPDSSEPFCFRGMEVILYKRERDECRRRAAEAVLTEQRRQRNNENSALLEQTPLSQSQQRIADVYRLLTRHVADDAYLRGLGDAKEAREVIQQSLLFPAALTNSPKPQVLEPSFSLKCFDTGGHRKRSEANNSHSEHSLSKAMSWKMILQRNSQLRSAESTDGTPCALQISCRNQVDGSVLGSQHTWKCCAYGGKSAA